MFLFLFGSPYFIHAQNAARDVSGVVKDEKGGGIAKVTITVKGTNRSKATGTTGSFNINATEGDTPLCSAPFPMVLWKCLLPKKVIMPYLWPARCLH